MYQHIVGIGVVAEKLCYLAAQVDKPLANLKVVFSIVVCALCVASHIELLSQLALCRVGHKWRVAWIVEREEPTLLVGFLGC